MPGLPDVHSHGAPDAAETSGPGPFQNGGRRHSVDCSSASAAGRSACILRTGPSQQARRFARDAA